MQQPLNCPCPQVYWVDGNATSPWAPPRAVFPCSSSEPAGPGQRGPPLPPPIPPPPLPPPLLPRPPPLVKKRRDCNTDLWLLMTFFMVLVALVGLGLGMYQLFHLQKELAELRESTSQEHSSSVAKLIGHPAPPSEKKSPRKVAHLTGKPNSRSIPLQWEDTYGIALISGVKYNKGGLVINDTGLYFVYSKVYFRGQSCNNQPLTHKVYMRTSKYPKDLVLMEGKIMNYCTTDKMWARSSYLGAVFNLTSDDHLYVNISQVSLVNFEESKTFFGLYNL